MSPRRFALAVLACFAVAAAPAAAHDDGPLVDLALTGTASAPAVNDGNAATTACGSDAVTVDLGRPRRLEGFGVSLAGDVSSARGGHGLGVFYWQPEWIPGIGWQPGAGTPNDNLRFSTSAVTPCRA
jgi:arabinogalactan endo-1,4-beta-galactosidase